MTQCPAIRLPHLALLGLQPVQLTAVQTQWGNTQQPRVVRLGMPTCIPIRQRPTIHTMRLEDLRQFATSLLQAKRLAQCLGFPALLADTRASFSKPLYSHALPICKGEKDGFQRFPPLVCALRSSTTK